MESVNFGALISAADGAFEPLPVGQYDVVVDSAEAGESTTHKLMYKMRYKVEGGPYNGRTVYNNITLTQDNPRALRMFFLNMKAMGLDESYFSSNPVPSAVAQLLLGKRCRVKVGHQTYNGELRENVESISAALAGAGGAGPSSMPATPVTTPAMPAATPEPSVMTPESTPHAPAATTPDLADSSVGALPPPEPF